MKEAPIEAALLAFSLCFSEGGFYLPLIIVDSLYGLDDRQRPNTSFARPLARCETPVHLKAPPSVRTTL